jgi:hypothetical protein
MQQPGLSHEHLSFAVIEQEGKKSRNNLLHVCFENGEE